MLKNIKAILAVLGLLILCFETPSAFAGEPQLSETDFALLPPFCRIFYIEKNRSMESRNELTKKFGTPFSLHHLCPGLKYLNDAFKQVDKKKKKEYSVAAAGELSYVLRTDGSFPLRPIVFRKRGHAHSLSGETDQAIADYESAIKLKPKYLDVYGDLFDIYAQLGKKEEAIKWLDRGLKIKPDYKPLLNRKKK